MSEYLENLNSENTQSRDEGQITYANEVISTIVSVATTEVEGISGITGSSGPLNGIIARSRIPRGVKVEVNGENVKVDISVTVDYGMPIQKVGRNCQENVRKSIESMTGLHVEKVDLHVVGVSFEKENQEMQQSQKLAMSLEEEEEQTALLQDEESVEVEYSEEESSVVPEDEGESWTEEEETEIKDEDVKADETEETGE
ncbi:MAG: Asp23/Gls24 family envelope stress response protein [Clostridia bacterium]|nr:Asp23/Gls24 family envelope stress response protein [Clostridia bacterium]